jgi:hypothetical protein
MNEASVREDFRRAVSSQIDLEPQGVDRFRVVTPLRFEDGDHFTVLLKREATRWILSDEAHTIMQLSYWLDEDEMDSGNRRDIIDKSLAAFSVEDREGELIIPIIDGAFR